MTERNVELLEKTMQHILDHPEQHHQEDVWLDQCGTPGCFMGWAMHFDGITLEGIQASRYGLRWDSSKWAVERLGLTDDEFMTMFNPGNTIEELQLMVKALVNGEQLDQTRIDSIATATE